jgi:DnaJ-class molecular chaperone
MYDFAVPNCQPGKCEKCSGSGLYRWGGAMVNGQWQGKEGPCHSCRGTGQQTRRDIARNMAYNRHKLSCISL